MTSSTSLARLTLTACLAASLAACASPPTAPDTGLLRVQQVSSDAPITQDGLDTAHPETTIDHEQPTTASGIVMAGTMTADEAKLYAKGFQDGYQDSSRAHRANKKRKRQLLQERRAADRTGARYQSPMRSETTMAAPDCEPAKEAPEKSETKPSQQSQPTMIAETDDGQD